MSSTPSVSSMPDEIRNVKIIRYASLTVLGGYAVATLYRVGVFRKILPRKINDAIEFRVEKIKARTEPIGDKERFAMARGHLMKTYGLVVSGMISIASGVLGFCALPDIPIAIPIITSIVPAVLLMAIPKKLMYPYARGFCFVVSWISAGYALGPVGYATQDSIMVIVMLSGCTLVGMCLPLFLTRGMISYVLSSQLLSFALSLSLVTAPKTSTEYSPFRALKQKESTQVILNADLNVLLTMQLISNMCITLAHTLPTIYRHVSWKGPSEELAESLDPYKEAFCICGGGLYVGYRVVSWSCKSFFRVIFKEKLGDQKDSTWDSWSARPSRTIDTDKASSACSGVLIVLWYVRGVSLMQKGDPTETLNKLRDVCAELSPMRLLLGTRA